MANLGKYIVAGLAAVLILVPGAARAGEPLSLGALLGPRADSVLRNTVPAAIDMAQKACRATAAACEIAPRRVADLPDSVRQEIEPLFPAAVLEEAVIYAGMPLNDPSMGIGFLNTLGMIASGGGVVAGMTFGNEVYLADTIETLAESQKARAVLAHELVHVAQYQTFGYEPYKEMYAKETARGDGYEGNALEKEAFLFEKFYPRPVNRAFFAFGEVSGPERVRIEEKDGGHRLLTRGAADVLETVRVNLTAAAESLDREATLALGLEWPHVKPQILDPYGGEPLFVFSVGGTRPARLVSNAPVAPQGPRLVVLATDAGVEVAWRTPDAFQSRVFGPTAQVRDINGDGTLEVVEFAAGAPAVWRWDGSAFIRG